MTAVEQTVRPDAGPETSRPRSVRMDRVALGLGLVAVGAGWFLAASGVAVPWRLAAPVALTLVGLLLCITVIVTRDGGIRAGRSGLAGLGAVLLALSVALGINAAQYAGPAGNVDLVPTAAEWPVGIRRSVGNVEIDLSRHPLPDRGTVSVQLGAGNVDLVVPRTSSILIDVRVTTGQVVVDGDTVASGVDLVWSQGSGAGPAVTVQLAAGEVRVHHG